MIICSCMAVTDRDVRAAALRGVATLGELERCSEAGSACGGCRPALEAVLEDARSVETANRPAAGPTAETQHAAW